MSATDLTRWGSRFDAAMGPPKDAMTLKQERHWREERAGLSMLLDDKSAIMTRREFDWLDDYSCSLPSGTFVGKIWKRGEPFRGPTAWYLGEYVDDPDPETVTIVWRRIYVVEQP